MVTCDFRSLTSQPEVPKKANQGLGSSVEKVLVLSPRGIIQARDCATDAKRRASLQNGIEQENKTHQTRTHSSVCKREDLPWTQKGKA